MTHVRIGILGFGFHSDFCFLHCALKAGKGTRGRTRADGLVERGWRNRGTYVTPLARHAASGLRWRATAVQSKEEGLLRLATERGTRGGHVPTDGLSERSVVLGGGGHGGPWAWQADDPGVRRKTHGKHSVGFVGGCNVVRMGAGLVDSVPGGWGKRRPQVANPAIERHGDCEDNQSL